MTEHTTLTETVRTALRVFRVARAADLDAAVAYDAARTTYRDARTAYTAHADDASPDADATFHAARDAYYAACTATNDAARDAYTAYTAYRTAALEAGVVAADYTDYDTTKNPQETR